MEEDGPEAIGPPGAAPSTGTDEPFLLFFLPICQTCNVEQIRIVREHSLPTVHRAEVRFVVWSAAMEIANFEARSTILYRPAAHRRTDLSLVDVSVSRLL